MAPEHVPVTVVAAVCALAPLFMSVLIIYQSWRVVQGRLERNQYFGIRTPSTMRSDQAWVAGHQAALRLAPWFLLMTAGTCAALWAAAVYGSKTIVVLIGIVGSVAVLALSIYAAVIASRAARSADFRVAGSSTPANGSEKVATGGTHTDRATKIVRVVVAAAVCVLTAMLLNSIVHGYISAIHHQLPPNTSFGFRDATTRSSLPAWYAAQKAGFTWLLFAGGPILIGNILFSVAAAIKRRPFWDILAMSLTAVVLLGIVLVIAGVHADGVARAITA